MARIISAKFKDNGKAYWFDSAALDINEGDGVIVETTRGTEYAYVTAGSHELADTEIYTPLKPVLRIATDEDKQRVEDNLRRAKNACEVCEKKITDHKLEMKLIDVECAFDGSKMVFYFTADGRVDFRELVKDLASSFKTRIELRQVGVRDEARMLGGLGPCGLACCCSSFLTEFAPVSIKMAKEQGLSLNPAKISGLCGRLMCCLKYEQSGYEQTRRNMPRIGADVTTPDGKAQVLDNLPMRERVRVKHELPDGSFDIREYPLAQVKFAKPTRANEVQDGEAGPQEPSTGENDAY